MCPPSLSSSLPPFDSITMAPKGQTANPLQPRTTSYEWSGPFGAVCLILGLPLLISVLTSMCNATSCSAVAQAPEALHVLKRTVAEALPMLPKAMALECAWLAIHAIFYLLPIGRVVQGTPLRNGEVLSYRLNAIHAFVLSHALILGGHLAGVINLATLADMAPALMIGAILICVVMSTALYVCSYRSDQVLTALGGNSGNFFYDYWIGRELNPRTGFLDWKFMCELRPGLIGWSILNWAYVAKAVSLGNQEVNIYLVALMHTFYVFDGLLLEVGNLTMMDIVMDGFGFMLCFGDLAWVPFIYTLQTRYLAYHPQKLSPLYMFLCLVLCALGYLLFRNANSEKDRFRKNPQDPSVRHLKVMKTSQGKSLIISGYWGVCRHPNYVGDWLMALSWAVMTGTNAAIPYFHALYFGILLVHRQLRDEEAMLHKYGPADWKKFCSIVKYRLIPYVY